MENENEPERTEYGFLVMKDDIWKDPQNTGDSTVRCYDLSRRASKRASGSGTLNGELGDSFRDMKTTTSETEGKRRHTSSTIALDRVMQHEAVLSMFAAFLVRKRCLESLLFWMDVESYQNSDWKASRVLGIRAFHNQPSAAYMTPPQIRRSRKLFPVEEGKDDYTSVSERASISHARQIFYMYLEDDGSRQVCLSSDEVQKVTSRIMRGDINRSLFRSAQRCVFRDMEAGMFPEFLETLNSKGHAQLNKAMGIAPPNAPALATANALSTTSKSPTSAARRLS